MHLFHCLLEVEGGLQNPIFVSVLAGKKYIKHVKYEENILKTGEKYGGTSGRHVVFTELLPLLRVVTYRYAIWDLKKF